MTIGASLLAQTDPGVRGGSAGAGGPLPGLSPGELAFFNTGLGQFAQVENFDDGLGPRFNLDSCGGCHAQPATGGTSPKVNPEIAVATKLGGQNKIPPFLSESGPVREVRFKSDGGVHALFVITGRTDAPAKCNISQPDFSNIANLSFRMPSPTFGAGLIEAISDTTIRGNLASNSFLKFLLGISGHVNTNGNDGTVTRFGWKAQNKSLLIFSGEAYNVEIGVTNENFPNEREENPDCATNGTPENHTGFDTGNSPSDLMAFVGFQRFLDQPTPACSGLGCSASIRNGRNLFEKIGCALCHTPSLTTGLSSSAALSNKQANLFSDLAVHHMGTGLADGIKQGSATGDEFRTAPLWGVGQRIFFLHDGRTKDLLQAIMAHDSPGSEAETVTDIFKALPVSAKQDILNFLRSL